jgi:hypothetical protein
VTEENKLRASKQTLRKISGLVTDEIREQCGWELPDLYRSSNIVAVMKLRGHDGFASGYDRTTKKTCKILCQSC